jgi:PQQ-like domain
MMRRCTILLFVIATAGLETPRTLQGAGVADWLQWGGPGRNFMPDASGLAASWPASGPTRLWSRALGEGHASILAEGGRIYTMYRPLGVPSRVRSQEEVVAALDAATGKTLWEFKYPAPLDGLDFSQGAGPHSTPLIVGDRIFATSTRKELFALDKATGQRVWSHDFLKEYHASSTRAARCSSTGRSSSPSAVQVRRSRRSISRPGRSCGRPVTSRWRPRRRS